MKRKLKALVSLLLLLLVVFSSVSWPDSTRADQVCKLPLCVPFGGTIIKKERKWCLIKIPSFPFVIPNPVGPFFYLTHVLQPGDVVNTVPLLHKFYDVPLLSNEKLRKRPEKNVQATGGYAPGASEAFRLTCTFNRDRLPKAPADSFGLLTFWGTACKPGEIVLWSDGKCKKVSK